MSLQAPILAQRWLVLTRSLLAGFTRPLTRMERTRDFGESYLGLALWHSLRLDELLVTRLLPPKGTPKIANVVPKNAA